MSQTDRNPTGDRRTLDPALQDQLETSLHGVYRFNAATAKYTIVWVWLLRVATVASLLLTVFAVSIGVWLLLAGSNLQLTSETTFFAHQWSEFLMTAIASLVAFLFFRMLLKGITAAYEASMELARRYRSAPHASDQF